MTKKQNGMTRIAEFTVEYIHEQMKNLYDEDGRPHNMPIGDGLVCRLNRKYIKMFRKKGTTCVHCGAVGVKYFAEICKGQGAPHLNLYTKDDTLMTKDHIIPRSKGGGDTMDNLQPMCYPCNQKKSDTYEADNTAVSQVQRPRISILTGECDICYWVPVLSRN